MMADRNGGWIQTFTGRKYWPIDPRPEDVDIRDIAHALAMNCRYTGHVHRFYSVAEHSWHVSHLVSKANALAGLLHDATEAYIADIARPIKAAFTNYKEIEQRNWLAIAQAFDLPDELPKEIHEIDRNMLTVEKAALLYEHPQWETDFGLPRVPVKIFAWCPGVAEKMFLQRFYELDALGLLPPV